MQKPLWKFVNTNRIREVRETTDVKEAAALLGQEDWLALAAAIDGDGTILFSLGRFAVDD